MAELPRRVALIAAAACLSGGAHAAEDVYGFRLTAIEGGPLDLGTWRDRPLLIVNTASFCGYTPQYAALQRVHERYAPRGLVVLGVPSNDFGQESADAGRIKRFCEAQFGVEFPMTTPERVRGSGAHPLFAWLARQGGGAPRWNFHKYLVARDGRSVRSFPTAAEPEAPQVVRAIEAAVG